MSLERHHFEEYQYKGFELEQACIGHEINWKEIFRKQGISEEKLTHEGLFKAYEKFYPKNPQIPQKKGAKIYLI